MLCIDSTTFPIKKGINQIGRHPDCYIVLNNPVSILLYVHKFRFLNECKFRFYTHISVDIAKLNYKISHF